MRNRGWVTRDKCLSPTVWVQIVLNMMQYYTYFKWQRFYTQSIKILVFDIEKEIMVNVWHQESLI